MNWINIRVEFLQGEKFRGSDPIDRATWLCLLGYCYSQETGGVILNCRAWPDRKWQQVMAVTAEEVNRICELWFWADDDLHVLGYPVEKEAEVAAKRKAGEKRAAIRWHGKESTGSASSSASSSVNSLRIDELDAEKEKEKEEEEEEEGEKEKERKKGTSVDGSRIHKALMSYCDQSQKRYSAEALKAAALLIASGEISEDELIAKIEGIAKVAGRNTTKDKYMLPSVYDLIAHEQFRSPVAAFLVTRTAESQTATGLKTLPTITEF